VDVKKGKNFELGFEAKSSVVVSGSFEYKTNPEAQVFLKNGKCVVGRLAATATCVVRVAPRKWDVELTIQKEWELLEGKTYPMDTIQIF
jgi:hypothetical protein